MDPKAVVVGRRWGRGGVEGRRGWVRGGVGTSFGCTLEGTVSLECNHYLRLRVLIV